MAKTTELVGAEADSCSDGVEQASSEAAGGSAVGLGCCGVHHMLPPASMPGLSKVYSSFHNRLMVGVCHFSPWAHAHAVTPYCESLYMRSSQIFTDCFCQSSNDRQFEFFEINEIERKHESRWRSYRALSELSHQNEINYV